MLEIMIKVDTNDADYAIAINEIEEEDLDKIKPLIAAIKEFKPYEGVIEGSEMIFHHDHNYPEGDCVRADLGGKSARELYDFHDEVFDIFEEFCPMCEYGFARIVAIEIWPIQNKTKLL